MVSVLAKIAFTWRGVNFQRLDAGRVTEHWTLADLFGLTRALG